MRTTLLLPLLALAAVASAQTVVLSPTNTSCTQTISYSFSRTGPGSLPGGLPHGTETRSLGTLDTLYAKSTQTVHGYSPITGKSSVVGTLTTTDRRSWSAAFALPPTPFGMALASATFSASAWGSPQSISIGFATGDGADGWALRSSTGLSASPGLVRRDVSANLRPLLEEGAQSVRLSLSRPSFASAEDTLLGWSSPRLDLTFAPQAVPEPAPFAALALALAALAFRRRRRA